MNLWLDTETFSPIPIKHGTYRYIEACELLLCTWAVDDGPVQEWDRTASPKWPDAVIDALIEADTITAHGAMFDRGVVNKHLSGIISPIPVERWRCNMVRALSASLPGGLDKLCTVLGVAQDQSKFKTGAALIRLFCSPRPKNSKIRRATRLTHPAEWVQFIEYAKQDITAMRAVAKLLPTWNYDTSPELDIWFLDQHINDRGFEVDLDLVRSAITAADQAKISLAQRAHDITVGEVPSTTQRDVLLEHILSAYGIVLEDMKSSSLEKLIKAGGLPGELRELLEIRLQACITSPSKYNAFLNGVSADGRMRGTLQFDGASRTTRWAGRTVQPQNFPRPEFEADEIEEGIELLKAGRIAEKYPNVMQFISSTARGCIVAPKGKKLVIADLANIEGRDQAWLANEEWKLQAFRDFDAGLGPDLYCAAYARAFDMQPEDVTKAQRKIGKVMELGCGYEGGVGAFLKFAIGYDLDIQAMAEIALPTMPENVRYQSEDYFDYLTKNERSTYGLDKNSFTACDAMKRLWRARHPNIAAFWKEIQATAVLAVSHSGHIFPCRRLRIKYTRDWLRIKLPSGRFLSYFQPQVRDDRISYMGVNQFTHQWQRLSAYGGKFFENACQAVACHIMKDNMPLIEAAGYKIVLTVHDEVICEAPDTPEFNAKHLSSLLAHNPEWAPGLPLAAAGFESYRYRKE